MTILETDGEKLLAAVRDLLAAKGLVSSAEISERIAITDILLQKGVITEAELRSALEAE